MNKPPDIQSPTAKRIKRTWKNIPELTGNDKSVNNYNVNKFLVIERDEPGDLASISPFLLFKTINYLCGEPKNVKKLRNGTILIETNSKEQSGKILKLTNIGMIKIRVQPHEKLNISKGVIFCPDLDGIEDKEILEELQKYNVKEIKRIITKKGGTENKTHLYILTFSLPSLPETINVGFQKLKVKMYVPNPIRCRTCLKFGHFADKCEKEPICGFCSKPLHIGTPCESFVPQCVNCKEKHHSMYIKCPKLIEEKEIKTIQFREKITYTAARRKVRESLPRTPDKSYAEATRNNRKIGVEVGTQTCISYDSCTNLLKPLTSDFSSITDASPLPSLPNPPAPLPPHPSPLSIPLLHPNHNPDPLSLPLPPSAPLSIPTSPIISFSTNSSIVHNPETFKTPGLTQQDISNKNQKKEKKKKGDKSKCSDGMETN